MNKKKPLIYSIRSRLLVGFVIVSLLPMLVATIYAINAFDRYIGKEFSDGLQGNLKTALLIYQLKEKTLKDLTRSVSEDKVVKVTLKIGPREQLANYIFEILKENNLDLLTITNQNGIVVARGRDFFSFGDDLLNNSLMKRALESPIGTPVIGIERIFMKELEEERLLQKAEVKLSDGNTLQSGLMIKAATPIYFEEEKIGVVIIGYLLNNSEITEEIKKEIGADVHILQKDIVVSTTLKDSQGLPIIGERIDLQNEAAPEDLIKKLNIKGRDYLVAFHFLKDIEEKWVGAMAVSTGIQEMIAMKKTTRNNLLFISFIGIALVTILAIYISHTIAGPVHRTIEAMVAVGKGDLSQSIRERRRDEIGKLIETFNQMTKALRESHTALEESKTVLEIKVAARTKELKELAEGLEEEVKRRTAETQERMAELEKFHKLTVGRELKMIELKKEIKNSKEELKKLRSEKK